MTQLSKVIKVDLHPVVMTLFVIAWHYRLLPKKRTELYNLVEQNLPPNRLDLMTADNLPDAFQQLRDVATGEFGTIEGVNIQEMLHDIVFVLMLRACANCRRIAELCSRLSRERLEKMVEIERYFKDAQLIKVILDSNRVFPTTRDLLEYCRLAEPIVKYVAGPSSIEELVGRIKRITAPKVNRGKWPAKSAPTIEAAKAVDAAEPTTSYVDQEGA